MRVAVVFDNFGPYHIARLKAAAQCMDVLAVEVRHQSRVYDWNASAPLDDMHHKVLFPEGERKLARHGEMLAAIDAAVWPFAPDAVALAGWSTTDALTGLSWALGRELPAIVMSESNRYDAQRTPAIERVKTSIVGAFAAGLCAGNAAKSYLVELGLPEPAVFLGYDVVDNAYFKAGADAQRASLGMPSNGTGRTLDECWRGRYFLASARFIDVKNLPGLLAAYAAYRARAQLSRHEAWPLILLGDGVLRPDLEARCHAAGLDDCFFMPGFKQYAELPSYYGSAGAFVHASTMEPWGLVINEAMASGLPVAVSNRCGCAEMLVADGVNGVVFDPYDGEAVADALWHLATQPRLQAWAAASRERMIDWGADRFAKGLQSACDYAVAAPRKRAGLTQHLVVRAAAELRARRG